MSAAQYTTGRFSWRCHEAGSVLYLGFEGELDLQAVPLTWRELQRSLAENPGTVVLDMSAISFMDSTGLRLLIRTKNEIEARDGRLLVSRLSPQVKSLIDICRLNHWFDPITTEIPDRGRCRVCDAPASEADSICGSCGSAI